MLSRTGVSRRNSDRRVDAPPPSTGLLDPRMGTVAGQRAGFHLDAVEALTVFFLLLFFVPARWVLPGLGAAGRPANIYAIGLFALWCVVKYLPDFEFNRTPLRWVVLANSLALTLSYGLAFDRGLTPVESLGADRAMLDVLAFAGLVLVASEGLPTTAHLEKLTKRLTYISGAMVVTGIIQFVLRVDPFAAVPFPGLVLNQGIDTLDARGSAGLIRARGSTLHAIEFAVVSAMILPLAIHHALHEPRPTVRRWRYGLALLHLLGSLLTVSRSAALAVGVGLAVLAWSWSSALRLKALAAGLASLVLFRSAIPGLLGTILSLFRNWNNDPSVAGRTSDYEAVAAFVSERPWFGRGGGTFIPAQYFFLDNSYLLRLLETGYVGLGVLLALILAGASLSYVGIRTAPDLSSRHLGVATMATISVVAVSMGTFDLLSFPTAAGVGLVVIGVTPVIARARLKELPSPGRYAPPTALKPRFQRPWIRRPWWHRFDPELRRELRRDLGLPAESPTARKPWERILQRVLSDQKAVSDGESSDAQIGGQLAPPPIDPGRLASSARWSMIGLLSKQLARIGFALILARLVGPANFGIIGQATIYLAFTMVFLDLGIGAALIQRESVSRQDEGTATVVNLVVAASLVALSYLAAPLLAVFFSTPELTSVVRVLSLAFLLTGLAVVPTAMMTRDLELKRLSLAEIASTGFGGAVGVASALVGAGYWALVIQTLAREAANTAILFGLWGPPRFHWSTASWNSMVSFGRNVLGAQMFGFVKSNSDNTLVGRYLGASALGYYALSYRVLMLPVQILGQTANRLMFPVLSRLKEHHDRAVAIFLRATQSLALVVVPVMTLVCLNAERAIPWAFGEEWAPAVAPLQVLAIAAILRAIGPVAGSLVLAAGHARFAFRWELFSTTCTVLAFVIGLRWGVVGVAWAYLAVGVPLQVLYMALIDRLVPIGLDRYLAALAPALTSAAGLVGAWWMADHFLWPSASPLLALVILTVAAVVGYLAVMRLAWHTLLREQLRLAKMIAGRRKVTNE